MKALSPLQSLALLLLFGAAVGGWLYGLHWKRVASGDLFSSSERLMIRLQDQLEVLTKENEDLNRRVRELSGEPVEEERPASVGSGLIVNPADEEIVLPSSRPSLPAPPQKIETH